MCICQPLPTSNSIVTQLDDARTSGIGAACLNPRQLCRLFWPILQRMLWAYCSCQHKKTGLLPQRHPSPPLLRSPGPAQLVALASADRVGGTQAPNNAFAVQPPDMRVPLMRSPSRRAAWRPLRPPPAAAAAAAACATPPAPALPQGGDSTVSSMQMAKRTNSAPNAATACCGSQVSHADRRFVLRAHMHRAGRLISHTMFAACR